MPEKYIYNNKLVDRKELEAAARQSNMDLSTYLQQAGVQVVNDNYKYNGKTLSAADVLDAANQSDMGFSDYVSQAGLEALPDVKKKEDTVSSRSAVMAGIGAGEVGRLEEKKTVEPVTPKVETAPRPTFDAAFDSASDLVKRSIDIGGYLAVINPELLPEGYEKTTAGVEQYLSQAKARLQTPEQRQATAQELVKLSESRMLTEDPAVSRKTVTSRDLAEIGLIARTPIMEADETTLALLKEKKKESIENQRRIFENDGDNYRIDNKSGKKIFNKEFEPDVARYDALIEKVAGHLQKEVTATGEQAVVISADTDSDLNAMFRSLPTTIDKVKSRINTESLNSSFLTGLEALKYTDENQYNLYKKRLAEGKALASPVVSRLTNEGAAIIKAKSLESLAKDEIDVPTYGAKQQQVQKELTDNFYGRPDLLQKEVASAIAEYRAKQRGGRTLLGEWHVSDREIDNTPVEVFTAKGIDVERPEFKEAIQRIKDNEGVLPFDNAIQKDGLARELLRGGAQPVKGISNFIGNLPLSDNEKRIQSELEPVANYATKRTEYFDKNFGLLADAFNGLGQFASQYALMRLGIGAAEVTGQAVGGTKAVSMVTTPLRAEAVAARQGSGIGNAIIDNASLISQIAVPYLQSYDQYYKSALEQTDNTLAAKVYAFANAGMEAASEKFFDNVKFGNEVLQNLRKSGFNPAKIAGMLDKKIFDEGAFRETLESGLKNAIEITAKGVKGLAKESFEEVPVAMTNFITDAMVNPASVEGRDIWGEAKDAFFSGMVQFSLPTLIGTGARFKKQMFSPETQSNALMVAAMNSGDVMQAISNQLEDGVIDQETANNKIQILNTATATLAAMPDSYANGLRMLEADRVKYLSLSVQEKMLQGENDSKNTDDAVKEINEAKIAEINEQKKAILNTGEESQEAAVSTVTPATDATLIESIKQSENISPAEATEGLQYFIDKAGEAPVAFAQRFGQDITDQLLAQVPTEKLTKNWKLFSDIDIDSPEAAAIEAELNKREAANREADNIPDEEMIFVPEMIGKKAIYNGMQGTVIQDGQAVVFAVDNSNREYELGNVNDLEFQSIKDFGIEQVVEPESVVSVNDAGAITVRGTEYVNNYSNPTSAINRDEDGNIVSVNLETADGKKRTFRGDVAEDIAYQIHLKQLNQDNETAAEFEQFVEADEATRNEIVAGENEIAAAQQATGDNEEVSRQKIEAKPRIRVSAAQVEAGQDNTSPLKQNQNAIQEPQTTTGVLRDEGVRGEGGLQEVEQGDQGAETTQQSQPEETVADQYDYKENHRMTDRSEGVHDVVTYDLSRGDENIGVVEIHEYADKGFRFSWINLNDEFTGKGIATDIYRDVNARSINATGEPLWTKNEELNESSKRVWDSLVKKGDAVKTDDGYAFKKPSVNETTTKESKAPILKTKKEIDALPEKERERAIDDLIYGEQAPDRDAFNRKTGKPAKIGRYILSDFIKQHDISGNETAKRLLANISKHPYFSSVRLAVTDKMGADVKGEAFVTAGLMKVNPNVDAETLAHEMMHFLTSKVLDKPFESLLNSEKAFRNDINSIIRKFDPDFSYLDKTLGRLGYKRSEYAKEIIAEAFTGSWFANELRGKEIEVVKTKRIDKNLIQKIIDKIIEFFGGKISAKTMTVKEKQNVLEALRDAFIKNGGISSARLKEINVPEGNDIGTGERYGSLKSRTIDVKAATQRMIAAGFSEVEIKAEFEKRGLKYESATKESNTNEDVVGDEKSPPSSPTEGGDFEVSGEDATGITHAQTEATRERFSLPEYDKNAETVAAWDEEASKKIREGYNIESLLSKMEKGGMPTAVEQRIMLKYIASIEAKIDRDPSNENLAELKRAVELSDRVGGSDIGKALVARKGTVYRDDSLAAFFLREMEEKGVDELTDDEKATVVKEYNDIKAANEALKQKVEALHAEMTKIKAGEVVSKHRKRQLKGQKTTDEFKAERAAIAASIKDKLAQARKDTSITLVPYAKELVAIAPDVAKLVRSYVEEGVAKLSDIIDNIHPLLVDVIPEITKKDVQDIIAGEYNVRKETKNELMAKLRDLRTQAQLLNKLEDLENGEVPIKEKEKRKRNAEIAEIRRQIKENDLMKVEDAKSRTQAAITRIEKQLASGDFAAKKPDPIKLDKEGLELQDKLIKLKKEREIRVLKDRYAKRTKTEKAKDVVSQVLNVPRSIMASMDFSAPLRQALIATISRPGLALQSFGAMFRSAFSQKNFDRWFDELKNSTRYDMMKELKLAISDPNSPFLTAREEEFMNGLAEKIPLIGKLIKVSERAYVQYLNKMRVDLFNQYAERFEDQGKTMENSPELYKKMSGYINNITGRGNLGKIEAHAPVLNALFFSPRLIASRLNLMNPLYVAALPPELKKSYFKDVFTMIGFNYGVLSLLTFALSGDDEEDKITIEGDPRSSDAGKLKQGNTRWDVWGGFQPYVTYFTRLLTQKTKSTSSGKIRKLDGKGPFGKDVADVSVSFFRNKLAPIPGGIWNIVSGRNPVGEEVTVKSQLVDWVLPLNVKGIIEAKEDQGVKGWFTAGIPATFGVGVQTYGEQKPKK